jgi:hypothetical protein
VEVNGQYHLSVALPTEKEPAVPMDGEIFGIQSRSGRFRSIEVLLSAPAIQPRFLHLSNAEPSRYSDNAFLSPK